MKEHKAPEPISPSPPGTQQWLVDIMRRLLAPDGCPWDREQTLDSLKPFLLEEAYEVLDAIDEESPAHHVEELGDVYFQIVFQAEVAGHAMSDIIRGIGEKLIRRHPHVFGDVEVDGELDLPSSDEDLVLPKSKKRRKRRTRKDSSSDHDRDRRAARKRKSRKAGSSSRSRSSSTDSLQPFRGAPSLGAASNRAQRDAQVRPHQVLVESLTQIVSSLPRSGEGAEVTRGDVFRRLPAVYRSWFDIKMAPVLRGTSGNQRSWREAKTLTTILDHLLTGNVLGSIMTLLGRLHAVTDVATNEGTSWALAQHHEIVPSDAVGLLTARSRANQAQDQRELLRTQGYMRGSGMPAAA